MASSGESRKSAQVWLRSAASATSMAPAMAASTWTAAARPAQQRPLLLARRAAVPPAGGEQPHLPRPLVELAQAPVDGLPLVALRTAASRAQRTAW